MNARMLFRYGGGFRWLAALSMAVALALGVGASLRAEAPARRWAFLVGVDDYAVLKDLEYAGADQRALAQQLAKSGFAADQIVLLHDQAKEQKYHPTRTNILRELKLFLKLVNRGDAVVLGYSGHGVSLGGKSYLCPSEASLEDPAGTMLPLDDLYASLQGCQAAFRLMLVDACRNDPSPDGQRSATPTRAVNDFARSLERPPEGILILSSCGRDQVAWEEKDFGHGVFMHFVLEGLRGKAADDDGSVRLMRLYDYASDQTKKYVARKFSAFQSPGFEGRVDGVFELARIDRGAPPEIPPGPIPAEKPAIKPGETITNSLGMKLVSIPAGEFLMGSEESAADLKAAGFGFDDNFNCNDERPQHRVRITRPFYLGMYEVTKGEFAAFTEATDYRTDAEKDGKGGWGWSDKDTKFAQKPEYTWRSWGVNQSATSPVVNVSWNDAAAFCKWLATKDGRKYRLPTEAEWEYACRAGTRTRFFHGDDPEGLAKVGNLADGTAKAKFTWWKHTIQARDGYEFTCPAGRYRPNAFGLYDMHGNAFEWCSDWYGESYYSQSPEEDPQGPAAGSSRVLRGGGWSNDPVSCRSSDRGFGEPSYRNGITGFRVACER